MSEIYQKLKPIIDECYQVFAYPKPSALHNICYPCCVSQEVAKDLITLPLKQLPQTHLYNYNTSAKDRVEIPSEIKYFLPKLIELLVQGEPLYHSVELYFERVGNCPAGSFLPKEQAVWQQFADAYLDEMLQVYPWQLYEVFKLDGDYGIFFDVLLMFYKGGVDISPFLQRWRKAGTPQAIAHYINDGYWVWRDGELTNPFADDLPAFKERVQAWVFDDGNKQYFLERILTLDESLIEPFYAWNGRYGMVEHLFDLMTDER